MPEFWVLNCKSTIFDFESALCDEKILSEGMTWKVSQQFDLISPGDVYFLYAGAPHKSIVACGYIEEGVVKQECDGNSAKYWKNTEKTQTAHRIFISISHIFRPYKTALEINPSGTGKNEQVPLGKRGSNKLVPPLAKTRLSELLNLDFD